MIGLIRMPRYCERDVADVLQRTCREGDVRRESYTLPRRLDSEISRVAGVQSEVVLPDQLEVVEA